MNTRDLQVLAHRADGVEGRPAVRLDEVHDRIRTSRRRRAAVAAVGAVAAVLAVIIGTTLVSDPKGRGQDPVKPTPSPTETFRVPEGQRTIEADVRADDIRGWRVLASLTNAQPAHRGATELSTTVTVHTDAASGENDMRGYCRSADPSVWVYTFYGEGLGTVNPCDSTTTELSPPAYLPMSTSQHFAEPMTARMYVTRVSPELAACARKAEVDCMSVYGAPAPLTSTEAEFGFRVYEHRAAPIVLRLFGYTYEALSNQDGQPWVVDRAVLAAPGANRLAVRLPDAKHRWLVGLFSTRGPHQDTCIRERGLADLPKEPFTAYLRAVDRVCGARLRLLVDGSFRAPRGDVGLDHGDPWTYAAPGAHDVTVDVTRGDPRNVRYAVIIWRTGS